MDMIVPKWHWRRDPTDNPLILNQVYGIALHHMDHPTADIWDVEKWHLDRDNKTWKGFGYNYWVGFDGTIYEGRGLNQGGGLYGDDNKHVISIGFQGGYHPNKKFQCNFQMPSKQFESGVKLIKWLIDRIPTIDVVDGHHRWGNTTCPGMYFPLKRMIDSATKDPTEILVDELISRDILTDREGWLKALRGQVPVNPEYLKIAFSRVIDKL
jgi:hypothetical protein